jgi:hypothetical protein
LPKHTVIIPSPTSIYLTAFSSALFELVRWHNFTITAATVKREHAHDLFLYDIRSVYTSPLLDNFTLLDVHGRC